MKANAILGWAVIAIINLGLLVLIGLVFLRFAPPKDSVTPMRAQLLAPADKDIVMRFRPNLRNELFLHHQPFTAALDYPQIRLSTNGLGFRDVDHSKTKAMDTLRVVLAGDSYMFATNMDQDNTPRDQLQRGLNEVRASDGPYHYEVFNFGLPGLNLEGMVRVNQRYAMEFVPDFILYSHICDDLSEIDVSTWYSWVQTWEPRLSFLPKDLQRFVLGPVLSSAKELLYKIDDFWEYRTSGHIAPDAKSLVRYKERMQYLLNLVWQLTKSHDHKVYFLDYCGYPPFKEVVQQFNQAESADIQTIDLTDIELDHTEHPTIAGIGETVNRLLPLLEGDAEKIVAKRRTEGLRDDGQCVRDGYAPPACLQCLPHRTGEDCAHYRFDEITCGGHHCCARTESGDVRCWGAGGISKEGFPHYGQAQAPQGQFSAISAGLYHSCGIQKDGRVSCWGRNQFGESRAPEGAFTSLSVGDHHSCGIRRDGTIHCWGESRFEKLKSPPGHYVEISLGGNSACARSLENTVHCWGALSPGLKTSVPSGWHKLTSGRRGLCALGSKGRVQCTDSSSSLLPDDEMRQIDAGGYFSCGITTDHRLLCWGPGMAVYDNPPAGLYQEVDVGLHHACALNKEGALLCWGHQGMLFNEAEVPQPSGS